MKHTRLLGALAFVLTLTSCGKPQGWTLYEVAEGGFSLGLPPGWQYIEMAPQPMATSLSTIGEQDAELASQLRQQLPLMALQGTLFYALDLGGRSTDGGFPTAVNVATEPGDPSMSLESYLETSASLLPTELEMARPDIDRQLVTLPAGQAGRLQYNILSDDGTELTLVQYLLLHDETVYIITFVTAAERFPDYAQDLERIAGSFRFMEP